MFKYKTRCFHYFSELNNQIKAGLEIDSEKVEINRYSKKE